MGPSDRRGQRRAWCLQIWMRTCTCWINWRVANRTVPWCHWGGVFLGWDSGGPGLCLDSAPHEAEKLSPWDLMTKISCWNTQNWRRMTSLASERYLFRWLSDHSGFRHVFFFVSRIFFWMGFCVYIIQFHGLNMVGIFSTNDVLENSGVVYLEPPGCQSPPGLHF